MPSHNKTRFPVLTTLSAAALMLTHQMASAQQADAATDPQTDSDDAKVLQEVVVVGVRRSLEHSLAVKRTNTSISDAITAEDLGQFPNTNVAEAMSLMPGVTVDRRFGQGERVSIDGTDPSLNLTFLDGHPVAQSIWLYGETPNRGFDHSLLAPEIVGELEVIKSAEARLPEGSLGGTVLLHSRKPLDLDANTFSGQAGYAYNDQADGGKPFVSAFYSWKNPDETFGFNVAAQHYEERIDRQGIEIFGYHPVSDYAQYSTAVADQVAAGEISANDMVPDEVNAAWFQQTRKRNSVLANMAFRLDDRLTGNLSGLYINENFDSYNQSVYNYMHWNAATMGAVDHFDTAEDGVINSGHSTGTSAATVYDNQLRQSEVTTKGGDLTLDYLADGWDLSGQAGYSKSENPDIGQWLLEPIHYGGFGWSKTQGFSFDDSAAAQDPSNWDGSGWFGNRGEFASSAEESYGQLDFSKDVDAGILRKILVGARYNEHKEDYSLYVYGGVNTGTLADVGVTSPTNILDRFNTYADFSNHIQIGANNVQDWVDASTINYDAPDPGSTLNNTWNLKQDNLAEYVQANFEATRVRGNVGVRFVQNTTKSTAYVVPNDAAPVLPAPEDWLQTEKSDKDFVLPSLNVVYDAADDVLLRFAASKVIAWTPYNLMVNQTFLNDTVLTGSGGNPDLDPYKSWNYNLSAEWYFDSQSVLAASVFYKDLDNYVLITPSTERHYNSIRDTDPSSWSAMVGTGGCTDDGYCDYSVSRPHDAGGATIKGFTLSWQQPFAETGFGMVANYTYADGDTDAGNAMPYQSKNSVSLSPYYEKYGFLARVNYNYRSKYLGAGYVAGAEPATTDSYTDISATLGYTINAHLSLSLDGMNLGDEKYFQYQDSKSMPVARYTTGRRYMASLQYKF